MLLVTFREEREGQMPGWSLRYVGEQDHRSEDRPLQV